MFRLLTTIALGWLVAAAPAHQPTGNAPPGSSNPAGGNPGHATPRTGRPGDPQPEVAPPAPPPPPAAVPVPDGPVVRRVELEGGLILEDLVIGEGYEVKSGGAVVAHYHGTRKADGFVFDSSFDRGQTAAFPLSGVIAGWQKGVPGMKIGGVRRLIIPAAMGYGARGAGANIPPNTDLVFVIKLVDAIKIEDVEVGTGEEATANCVPVTTYTIKDTEGKVLEAVEGTPYVWLPGEYQGIQFGVPGMKVGGTRRIVVPAQFNVWAQPLAEGHVQNVPVTLEVKLVAVRNLPQGR
ncbi:MAG: FKBP-type peptidyl-prolyl cis-trans isomerase [Phycisphaeraceae bacterium]|nr:FKBP-type peptidyl-prolyl cis-trans isomerase [Phycisphaeraceae bacterium]